MPLEYRDTAPGRPRRRNLPTLGGEGEPLQEALDLRARNLRGASPACSEYAGGDRDFNSDGPSVRIPSSSSTSSGKAGAASLGQACQTTPPAIGPLSLAPETQPSPRRIQTIGSKTVLLAPEMKMVDRNCGFTSEELQRYTTRFEGIEQYAVLSALVSGFAFSSITAVTYTELEAFPLPFAVGFVCSGAMAFMSSLYATIVFALCALYGKAALGMNRDLDVATFANQTRKHRSFAFHAFITALVALGVTFAFLMFVKTPFAAAVMGTIIWALIGAPTVYHTKEVMDAANDYIFY